MAEVNKQARVKAKEFLARIAAEAVVSPEEMRLALMDVLNTEDERPEEDDPNAPREEDR